jgi:hypothetical protein
VKKTNLTLLNMTIQFNEFGGLKFPSVNIFVLAKGVITQVGSYETNPSVVLSINSSLIQWHANGTVRRYCTPQFKFWNLPPLKTLKDIV